MPSVLLHNRVNFKLGYMGVEIVRADSQDNVEQNVIHDE